MRAVVNNFRGIKQAQIDINPIALLTGMNGAGKTSIARAVAAAATGRGVPFDKLTKKDCGIMLHNGTKAGMVEFENDDGGTLVEWPKAEVKSSGRPPFSSDIAAGLTSLLSIPKKDALGYLINLLKATITMQQFSNKLAEAGIEKETIEIVWKTIEAQGWDAAVARAKEKGTKLKGIWENLTGEKFGSKKSTEWFPGDWDETLSPETDELDLAKALAEERTNLEKFISQKAVGEAEILSLKALSEKLPILEKDKKEAEDAVVVLNAELKGVEDKLRQNPDPDAKQEFPCPHCQGAIHIKAVSGSEYILSKAEKINPTELKEARDQNASLCGQQQNVNRRIMEAGNKVRTIDHGISMAKSAKEKLETIGEAKEGAKEEDVSKAREAVKVAEIRMNALKKYKEAKKTSDQITVNQQLIDFLDETGLRRIKLSECLHSFSESYVYQLCEVFGIKNILMDADLNIQVGKTPYQMLSASEQFRVNTILQLAISQLERASVVIIDAADILDNPSRGKLLQAVKKSGMRAIICMTIPNPDKAPNLADAGMGCSYWVENGTCTPFQSTKREAA